jgi:RNA polymerase sigma-70 factor (ECF subfamily)
MAAELAGIGVAPDSIEAPFANQSLPDALNDGGWPNACPSEDAKPDGTNDFESDDETVGRTLAGDRDAFEVLVRRHSARVFNIIGSFFRRRDMVEDIAQDVFIKAFVSLSSYTLGRSFAAWIAKIAVNCCYDHLRAERRRGEQSFSQYAERDAEWLELQMLEGAQARYASEQRQRDASETARRLLSRLAPEDRIVVVLMDRDGFSVSEISDLTGWGQSKVKVRAFRARRALRAAMRRLIAAAERKQRTVK